MNFIAAIDDKNFLVRRWVVCQEKPALQLKTHEDFLRVFIV